MTMRWRITYYNQKLEEKILNLPDGLLARYLRLTDLMCEYGSSLGMPHTRPFKGGLFELRLKGKKGIARVFFCMQVGDTIMMLHCFIKKSQKTPGKEITIARNRMAEVNDNDSC